jgi:hypothetical protein
VALGEIRVAENVRELDAEHVKALAGSITLDDAEDAGAATLLDGLIRRSHANGFGWGEGDAARRCVAWPSGWFRNDRFSFPLTFPRPASLALRL